MEMEGERVRYANETWELYAGEQSIDDNRQTV